jgi:hypothetical protein
MSAAPAIEPLLLQHENATLRERCANLEYWCKATMQDERVRYISKRDAAIILGRGGRRKAQQIDAGIKDTTKNENAKIKIDIRKIFESVTKIPYYQL